MDITYLLWLQDFRNATDNILSPFFMELSNFAIGALLLVPIFVYWAVNKRDGMFMIMAYNISMLINGIVKLTFCVYRPWIRDARVIPYGNSISSAGGYSFPSGHTMESSPVYGGVAVLTRKKYPLISWICIIAIILTAISRNYLGVHTPQDVVVGTILGLCSVWIASRVTGYIYAHPERENMVWLITIVILALSGAYMFLKPYPMDYVDGKLIVNPQSMILSSIGPLGLTTGCIIGRYIERKYIDFKAERFTLKSCIIALIGLVPVAIMDHRVRIWLIFIGKEQAKLAERFILGLFITLIWPVVLKLFKAGEN